MSFRKFTASVTRPNDTTQYAVGDVIAAGTPVPLTFTNIVLSNNGSNRIVKAMAVDGAAQATKAQIDLYLFDTTLTVDADNAAFTPTDAEMEKLVAIIRFDTFVPGDATAGAGGNAVAFGKNLEGFQNTPIRAALNSRTLYGVAVAKNTYTPVADEKFTFVLWVE